MLVLQADPRMKVCALAPHIPHTCSKKIDWHHNLIYAGRQSDVPETIIAICSDIHEQANNKEVRELLDWIMLNMFNPYHFEIFAKSGLLQRKSYLNKKYGK